MTAHEYRDLRTDIREHGIQQPLDIDGSTILDGRHRFTIAQELAFPTVPVRPASLNGGGAITYMVRMAILRRHLTDDQRAVMLALWKKENSRRGRPRKNSHNGVGISASALPKVFNLPRRKLGISPQRNVKFHRILGKCRNFNSLAKNRSPILEGDFRVKKWEPKIAGSACLRRAFPKCCETYPPFVGKYPLFEVLKGQGLQNNQQITFLSDGGDTVPDLQLYLNPHSDHVLDWFHVTMRITVLGQYLKGLKHHNPVEGQQMAETLERSKRYLWHGNLYEAFLQLKDLEWDAEGLDSTYPTLRKLRKAIEEFHDYIENNRGFIPNYGERWRYGERISTGFVESTVNAVVSKRFAKKQQMQWSKQGAHVLLQARVRVLNDELRARFAHWYPGFGGQEPAELKLAA